VYGKDEWGLERRGLIHILTGKEQSIADLTQEHLSALCDHLEAKGRRDSGATEGSSTPPPAKQDDEMDEIKF